MVAGLGGIPVERVYGGSAPIAQFCFEPVDLDEEF